MVLNKYDILQSKNKYINYTIGNYINCYADMNEEEISKFTEMFKLLPTHQIYIGNHLIDKKPVHGVKLEESMKKKHRNYGELGKQLEIVSTRIEPDDKKDMLFFQSVTHLCKALEYLDSTELMQLNEVFQTISNYEQTISSNAINDGKTFFYPYNRYPKRK